MAKMRRFFFSWGAEDGTSVHVHHTENFANDRIRNTFRHALWNRRWGSWPKLPELREFVDKGVVTHLVVHPVRLKRHRRWDQGFYDEDSERRIEIAGDLNAALRLAADLLVPPKRKKRETIEIPFDADGNQIRRVYNQRAADWRSNDIFQGRFRFVAINYGRVAMMDDLGHKHWMSQSRFNDVVTYLSEGWLVGRFCYEKKGEDYGLLLVSPFLLEDIPVEWDADPADEVEEKSDNGALREWDR